MSKASILKVIENDYCIGCGVCAALTDQIEMVFDENGYYKAKIEEKGISNKNLLNKVSEVCPFSNESKDEDQISTKIFNNVHNISNYLGRYSKCYIGHVIEGDFREKGSSGGIGKWVAHELFRLGYVDKVIQVKQNERTKESEPLYLYKVCTDNDSIRNGSKSAYYPIEMSEVLNYIRYNPGKYLITGVPCFIKSIRLLQMQEEIFRDRIKFTIGLVCGHLKSENYANMIGWQLGIAPNDIKSLDFRKKIDGTKANEKGVEVKSMRNPNFTKSDIVQNLFGTNYGAGFFKLKACDFCDDVVSETADITVGDAWLPDYINDGKGNNIVIVRNTLINKIIEEGINNNKLSLKTASEEEIIKSQDAGFRHRRQGLAYRLYLADKKGEWRPNKRVKASNSSLNKTYKRIHKARIHLRIQSHSQFKKAIKTNNFIAFKKIMNRKMSKLKPSLTNRIILRVKRIIK